MNRQASLCTDPRVSRDPVELRRVDTFLDYAVSPERLQQAVFRMISDDCCDCFDKVEETVVRFVIGDIMQEEADIIDENDLDRKTIRMRAEPRIREWVQTRMEGKLFV